MGRGPDTGPYRVRTVRSFAGGATVNEDMPESFRRYALALEAARGRAAALIEDPAVAVYVIDRDGVAVHRACGDRRLRPQGFQRLGSFARVRT